jgi:anti-sigma B factor antagonist
MIGGRTGEGYREAPTTSWSHELKGSVMHPVLDLSLSVREVRDRTVVTVAGEIDVYTAPQLREQLIELANGGATKLVLDLEAVEMLDSTGLGVLLGASKRARERGGSLRLVCSGERILRVIRITGLIKVLPVHPSVRAAVSARSRSTA